MYKGNVKGKAQTNHLEIGTRRFSQIQSPKDLLRAI